MELLKLFYYLPLSVILVVAIIIVVYLVAVPALVWYLITAPINKK